VQQLPNKLNRKMDSQTKKGIAVLVACGIVGVGAKLYTEYADNEIIKRGRATTAYVIAVHPYRRPSVPEIEYYYIVGEDTINSNKYIESIVNFRKLKSLEGQTLTVIYDTVNIRQSKLIIDESKYR